MHSAFIGLLLWNYWKCVVLDPGSVPDRWVRVGHFLQNGFRYMTVVTATGYGFT